MNQYRAKSQLYQVFVSCESTAVQCDEIHIPKLSLSFNYKADRNRYIETWNKSSEGIRQLIENRKKLKLRQLYFELNHILIENSLIDLLQSEDNLNRKLASEILIQKFDNIKIEYTK